MFVYWWCLHCGPVKGNRKRRGCPRHGMKSVMLPEKRSRSEKFRIIQKIVSDTKKITDACFAKGHNRIKNQKLGMTCQACEGDGYSAYISIVGVLRC